MIERASISLVLALLLACGTTSTVPDVWRDPAFDSGPFEKILVIGVAHNAENRRLFEDRFAEEISKRGTAAAHSYGVLPDVGQLSESAVTAAVADGNFDGVLITHLVSHGEETSTVQPRPQAMPRLDPGYYNDYTATWEIVQQPSYTTSNEVVRLDTRLYDVASRKRVWDGRSTTLDPRSLAAGIASVTAAIAKQLAADGMIP